MDQFIDRIGSQISSWLWFARSSRLGSDDLVTDLLQGVAGPARDRREADERVETDLR